MDVLMSGENFKGVTHMLEQMEAFVEKTEQGLKQGRERVGKLRTQYQTLKANETVLKRQQEKTLPSEPELKAPVNTIQQPAAEPAALKAEARKSPTKRVLRASPSQPDSEPSPETEIQHESTERTYLRK